jgi:hypothetical protein
MVSAQRAILLAGAILIAGMCLYPPWRYEYRPGMMPAPLTRDAGYGWIHASPKTSSLDAALLFDMKWSWDDRKQTPSPPSLDLQFLRVVIDFQKLVVQCVAAAVLTVGASLAYRRNKR